MREVYQSLRTFPERPDHGPGAEDHDVQGDRGLQAPPCGEDEGWSVRYQVQGLNMDL